MNQTLTTVSPEQTSLPFLIGNICSMTWQLHDYLGRELCDLTESSDAPSALVSSLHLGMGPWQQVTEDP